MRLTKIIVYNTLFINTLNLANSSNTLLLLRNIAQCYYRSVLAWDTIDLSNLAKHTR